MAREECCIQFNGKYYRQVFAPLRFGKFWKKPRLPFFGDTLAISADKVAENKCVYSTSTTNHPIHRWERKRQLNIVSWSVMYHVYEGRKSRLGNHRDIWSGRYLNLKSHSPSTNELYLVTLLTEKILVLSEPKDHNKNWKKSLSSRFYWKLDESVCW